MKNNKIYIFTFSLFFELFLIINLLTSVSAQIPVIDVNHEIHTETFTPTALYGDWLYYINFPGTEYASSNILYKGISGSNNAQYTYFSSYNSFSYSSVNLARNEIVNSNLLRGNLRRGYHPLFPQESYPRAIRIQSTFDPEFLYTQRKAINIHIDHSFTFLAEAGESYFGFLNTTKPFFIDIHIYDCDADGNIIFPDAFPSSGYSIGNIEKKMTYPFFPKNNSIKPLNFTLWLDQGSLVTLTPHLWEFPEYAPTINVNTTFSGKINQGTYSEIEENKIIYPENELFSIRIFNLQIEEGKNYKLFIDFRMLEYSGCTSGQPYVFLIAESIDVLPYSSLNQNGFSFQAKQNETIKLVFFAQGWSNGEYTIYYHTFIQPEDEPIDSQPLNFNKNLILDYNYYYYFSLDKPHMIAVNYSYYCYFDLYIPGLNLGEWIQVENQNFFNPEYGNLLGDYIEDIGNNWRYFPAGNYAIRVTWYWSNSEIFFTKIPVIPPSTVTVEKNSIFAFELPITKNLINFVNISSNDHIYPNQRVNYEYSWVGKYNEMIKDVYYSGNAWIGNRNNTGSWLEWDSNNTQLAAFLPTRDYEIPILIIRPYDAEDSSFAFPNPFIATLTISINIPTIQHYGYNNWNNIGGGYFIPKIPTFSSVSVTINDDLYAGMDHLYGIPLFLPSNRIYNISVYTHGNYTNGPSTLNATIDNVYIHGGNLNNLAIFNTYNSGWDNTKYWNTMLISTVSSTSYLFIDVIRSFDGVNYRNSTLEIYIEKIPVPYLDFELPPYEYNSTLFSEELYEDHLLVSQIEAPEMKKPRRTLGFELVLSICTLLIIVPYFSRKGKKS